MDERIAQFWQVCTLVKSCALFKIQTTIAMASFIYKCHPHLAGLVKVKAIVLQLEKRDRAGLNLRGGREEAGDGDFSVSVLQDSKIQ